MKHNILFSIVLLFLTISIVSCSDEDQKLTPVSTILLDKKILELVEGETFQLTATVNPTASDKTVNWTSLDESIAIVDNQGNVTAQKEGITSITAKAGDKAASCKVTISKQKIILYPNSSYELSGDGLTLTKWKGDEAIINISGDDILKNIENIGAHAFDDNKNITKVIFGEKVKTVESYAFHGCDNLAEVELSRALMLIGSYAFTYSGITGELNLLNVQAIGESAFTWCQKITSIIFPKNAFNIGTFSFNNCHGLTELKLPASVNEIGMAGFANCSKIENVIIEKGQLTKLEQWTFYNNGSLKTIHLPDNIVSLGEEVFIDCISLEKITSAAVTPPSLGPNVFKNIPSTCELHVPANSITAYTAAWSAFTNITAIQ